MKKKKITGRQIKLMISLISLAIFIVSYFYIYNQYVEKTEAVYKQAELVKAQIKDRKQKLAEEDGMQQKLKEVKEQRQAIIDSYPVCIEKEDNFMFLEQMEKKLNIQISSINISDNSVFYNTILPAVSIASEDGGSMASITNTNGSTASAVISGNDNNASATASGNGNNASVTASNNGSNASAAPGNSGNTTEPALSSSKGTPAATTNSGNASLSPASGGNAGVAATPTMTATVNSISMNFVAGYDSFKELSEYIKNYPDHTIIDSVAVSYDNTSGVLSGSLVLKRFALTGTGKLYEAPAISDIGIGTDNIFNSGKKKKKTASSDSQQETNNTDNQQASDNTGNQQVTDSTGNQ